MKDRKRILLISSLALLPFTFVLFQLTTLWLGPKWGYITGFLGYWAYCMVTAWLLSGSDWNYFKAMWTRERRGNYGTWISLAAFIPVVGVFFVSFLPNASRLTFSTSVLLIFTIVLNGTIEELYWRGLYLLEYPNDTRIGFFLSWLLFGAWHISLWFARQGLQTGSATNLCLFFHKFFPVDPFQKDHNRVPYKIASRLFYVLGYCRL